MSIKLHFADSVFSGAVDRCVHHAQQTKLAGINIEVVREPTDGNYSDACLKKPFCAAGTSIFEEIRGLIGFDVARSSVRRANDVPDVSTNMRSSQSDIPATFISVIGEIGLASAASAAICWRTRIAGPLRPVLLSA